jgi:hypothetical protein
VSKIAQDTPLSSIYEQSLRASTEVLAGLAPSKDRKPRAVFSSARGAAKKVFAEYGVEGLPIVACSISAIDPNIESFNRRALKRNGVVIGSDDDFLYYLSAVPVRTILVVSYLSNNGPDVLEFSQQWMYQDHELQFKLKTRDHPGKIGIKVQLEPSIVFPEHNENDETLPPYQLETAATIWSYVGKIYRRRKIKNVRINESILYQGTDEEIVLTPADSFNVDLSTGEVTAL